LSVVLVVPHAEYCGLHCSRKRFQRSGLQM
jgi:hypothetical protein